MKVQLRIRREVEQEAVVTTYRRMIADLLAELGVVA